MLFLHLERQLRQFPKLSIVEYSMRLISLHVLVDECLSFIKPVWSGCIIRGVIFSSLLARAFISDIGR